MSVRIVRDVTLLRHQNAAGLRQLLIRRRHRGKRRCFLFLVNMQRARCKYYFVKFICVPLIVYTMSGRHGIRDAESKLMSATENGSTNWSLWQ